MAQGLFGTNKHVAAHGDIGVCDHSGSQHVIYNLLHHHSASMLLIWLEEHYQQLKD